MTNFKFKRPAAQYKNKKGDRVTISNSTMTDEKAIAFLKTKPSRIELFSEYPSNWKEMLKKDYKPETEEAKKKRIAVEAEAEAKKKADEEAEAKAKAEAKAEARIPADEVSPEKAKVLEVESQKEDALLRMSLKDLRAKYPDIKAISGKDFVEKVLAL